jgi:hypothetical protein
VVDLTNTTRFYDSKAVEEKGCKYVKMQCRGYDIYNCGCDIYNCGCDE